MTKLIKYLKPFIFPLILAISLLYLQAMADLSLPDYMSNIINTGIQKGGIEHATPDIILEKDMNIFLVPLDDSAKGLVLDNYNKLNSGDSAFTTATKNYPKIGDMSVYVLKDNPLPTDLEKLDLIMAKSLMSFLSKGMPQGESIDLSTMTDDMIRQAGGTFTKGYYQMLGRDVDAMGQQYILKIGGIMLLITIAGAVCSIAVGFIASKIAAGLGRSLRKNIFSKVSSFSNAEFDTFSTASLITRSTNDVTQIQTLMVLVIRMVFYAPILGIGGVIKALDKSTSMSWIIAIAVILLLGFIMLIFTIALPKYKSLQNLVDKINRITRENLTGMMVSRAFNTQKFEENRFDMANKDLTRTNLFVNRITVLLFPVMMLIMNGVSLLIIWVGAEQISMSAMQVGDMMAFMQYAMQIIMAFLMLSMMFILVPRASVSASRVSEVLSMKPVIEDPIAPKSMSNSGQGTVTFSHVSFKYPGAEESSIKDINFTAEPGKVTALIGSTGSGKSTLVNLIPRFYDATEGSIKVDGIDVRDITQHDLRHIIGYVPQKASLFSGTIRSNLKIGDENASDDLLKRSADIAQATEIIANKEDGFESSISQGGNNVSGGQKQRFSIARALVKQAKIYIFDDSFSALDFKTDAALRRELKDKTGDSTVIIVAQRISTIRNADQIVVLDDGKIVGKGTHDDLMNTCETYKEIAYSQLSKEELA